MDWIEIWRPANRKFAADIAMPVGIPHCDGREGVIAATKGGDKLAGDHTGLVPQLGKLP